MLFLSILLFALLVHFLQLWWMIVPVAFMLGMQLGSSLRRSFWYAFLANSLVWFLFLYGRIMSTTPVLAEKVAAMLLLPHWSLLVMLTVLLGGLLAGTAAAAGYLSKQFLKTKTYAKQTAGKASR